MNLSYCAFLSLGIHRRYSPPAMKQDDSSAKTTKVTEPHGSMNCRRNILALASVLVLAGLTGIDPHELSVFGIHLAGEGTNYILAAAAIAAQLYWYIMRGFYLKDGGTIAPQRTYAHEHLRPAGLSASKTIERSTADLVANYVALALTGLSWMYIADWLNWI